MSVAQLTRRQREVLERFIEGKSIIAIAHDLGCSPWTVRAHLSKAAAKIDRPGPPMRKLLMYGPDLIGEGV